MISSSTVSALRPINGSWTSWTRSSTILIPGCSVRQYHQFNPVRTPTPLNAYLNSTSSSRLSDKQWNKSLFSTKPPQEKKSSKGKLFLLVVGFGVGALAGLGYMYRKMQRKVMPIANIDSGNDLLFSEEPPVDFVAKKIVNPDDTSNLDITLYQYEPCPFCKKVRAYLDFAGLNYKVVEVNPVTKKQVGWSAYKKVPIVVVKVNNSYQQLNDSSMIISALSSHMTNTDQDLVKLVKYYPIVEFEEDGKKKAEIMNRYFLMFGDQEPKDRTKESIVEERRWRKWSDDVLMHTLSPNIYRTWDESLEAFNMFSENGDWDLVFSFWERQLVIYVGAAAMYMIGKRLKKRHNLMDDVRQSLYQEVNYFLKTIKTKGTPFLGGEIPNLADLAVFGCISSIDGTRSFADLMSNTHLGTWYEAMKAVINSRRGRIEMPPRLSLSENKKE